MESAFYDVRIRFGTYKAAAVIIGKLLELAKRYGYASVADLYELCDIDCSYLNNKYGWTTDMLKDCSVVDVGPDFTIKLPASKPVDEMRNSTATNTSKVIYRDYVPKRKSNESNMTPATAPTTKHLNIIIHTKELVDPDATFADIFKYIHTITDRAVTLSVM